MRDVRRLVAVLVFYALCSGWCWLLHVPEAAARSDGLWAFVVFGDNVDESGRIDPFVKTLVRLGALQLVAVCWALIAVQGSLLLGRWRRLSSAGDPALTRWPLAGAFAVVILMGVHVAAEIVYLWTDRAMTLVNAATVAVSVIPVELACLALFARWLSRRARRHADMVDRLPAACV